MTGTTWHAAGDVDLGDGPPPLPGADPPLEEEDPVVLEMLAGFDEMAARPDVPERPLPMPPPPGPVADPGGPPPEPPPPPPPEPEEDPPEEGPARGPIRGADASVRIHGGRLCFYRRWSNFEAVCGNGAHGKNCIVRRTPNAKYRGDDGFSRGGRPVGFLIGFLSLAAQTATMQEHKAKALWEERLASQDARMLFRAQGALCAGFGALEACERARAPGEPLEQLDLVGLIN